MLSDEEKQLLYGHEIEACQDALRIDPDNIHVMYNLATYQYNLGDIRAAIDTFTRIVELNPNHVAAHYNLYTVLSELHNDDYDPEALKHLYIAVELDPLKRPVKQGQG